LARILYVGLWCESDREGRMEWKPKTFKLRYLPGDSCDVDTLAQELIDAKMLVLYEVEGVLYAEIPSFTKHQVINNRESDSVIPTRVKHASLTRQAHVKAEGKEGRKGKEGPVDDGTPPDPAPLPVALIPLVDGTEFEIFASKVTEWAAAYPAVNVPQKLLAIRQWCIAHPSRRKTRRGAEAFVVAWLCKDQDSGRGRGGGNEPQDPSTRFAGAI
jgi:hypothetical protein